MAHFYYDPSKGHHFLSTWSWLQVLHCGEVWQESPTSRIRSTCLGRAERHLQCYNGCQPCTLVKSPDALRRLKSVHDARDLLFQTCLLMGKPHKNICSYIMYNWPLFQCKPKHAKLDGGCESPLHVLFGGVVGQV